ncbi:MAG: DegV family protein [Oscillospiraceae bacterium]|nr:DegV family protein [Oscillospiraceae bacterium]
MSFAVLTDTSGNLPKRLTDEHEIGVIPFAYTVNGVDHVCLDIEAFDGASFYRDMKAGQVVTTSQISPRHYADFFEPCLQAGQDVIFVSMSSGISGSCNSANIAADMLRETYPERHVRVIDTKGAALGEGLVALRAAACRDAGMSFEETAAAMEALSTRMCNVFTVDDLMFLRRGGRLSNFSAIVGTVLNIKPLLKGDEEGKIVAFAKLRGRRRSIEALAEKFETLAVAPETQTVGVVNAACRGDAEALIALLRRKCPPKEIISVDYEPVTGCHVGPGALALFFEGRDDVRTAVDGAGLRETIGGLIGSVRERAGLGRPQAISDADKS